MVVISCNSGAVVQAGLDTFEEACKRFSKANAPCSPDTGVVYAVGLV